jgi:hypothetical protein
MTLAYNIEPQHYDLVIKQGDTLNFTFQAYVWNTITEEWDLFDLTGMQLDIYFRRKDYLLVKTLTSAGLTPQITIAGTIFNFTDSGFLNKNVLDYDIQVTDGANIFTIQEGGALIKKQIT